MSNCMLLAFNRLRNMLNRLYPNWFTERERGGGSVGTITWSTFSYVGEERVLYTTIVGCFATSVAQSLWVWLLAVGWLHWRLLCYKPPPRDSTMHLTENAPILWSTWNKSLNGSVSVPFPSPPIGEGLHEAMGVSVLVHIPSPKR